jgi:aminopeptidase N
VVFRRGDRDQAQFALNAAAQLLPYYNDYFGVRYPLPKLDLIAGPGSSSYFGAMENWGAMFFFDEGLLIDDRLATETDRLNVYVDIAHEMAHQWFGDLVTMKWWDDLWLNEGFATWMEDKATDHFHPEWNLWLVALTQVDNAMRLDSRGGTHPVIQPIRDVLQADQDFDTITYSKGMAVIRMLEHYVGEQAFRNGVHDYLKSRAYGNAVTDDLWAALDKASVRPVSKIAREFTLQSGVPLIKAARGPQGVMLTQDRFYSDASARTATAWDVPVVERSLAGGPVWRGVVRRDTAQNISLAAQAIPIVNDGGAGYFRTLYSQDLFAGLSSRFGEISAANQLGLFHDTTALALAGYEPLPDVLMLAGHIKPGTDPVVARAVVTELDALDGFYRELPGRPAYAAYARGLLRPLLAKLGWSESPQDRAGSRPLRGRLLQTLGQLDDPDVIAKARSLFGEYLKDPRSLTGEPRIAVLGIVATHADATTWEQLRQLALHATVPTEAQRYFRLLGTPRDRALAQRALDLTLTNEASVTVRPDIIERVAAYYPDMAFEFAAAHLQEVYAGVEPDNRVPFMAQLMAHASSTASADTLRAFAKAHIPPNDQHAVQVRLAEIAYNAKVRKDDIPELDRWLQSAH